MYMYSIYTMSLYTYIQKTGCMGKYIRWKVFLILIFAYLNLIFKNIKIFFQFYWDKIGITLCKFKMYKVMIWYTHIAKWLAQLH